MFGLILALARADIEEDEAVHLLPQRSLSKKERDDRYDTSEISAKISRESNSCCAEFGQYAVPYAQCGPTLTILNHVIKLAGLALASATLITS